MALTSCLPNSTSSYWPTYLSDDDEPRDVLRRKFKPPIPSILKISSASIIGGSPQLFFNPAYEQALHLRCEHITTSPWKIFISINPTQLDTAWPILQSILIKTNLELSGTIQREDTLPGQQIDLTISKDQQDACIWKSFLENIAQSLHNAHISCDPRPINSDPEQIVKERSVIIPTNGSIPPYISYKSVAYLVSFGSFQEFLHNFHSSDVQVIDGALYLYPNKLKNREFSDTERSGFESEKTGPLSNIGAVFSDSKTGCSAQEKTDSSTCLGIHSIRILFAEEYANLPEETKSNPTHAPDFLRQIHLF